MLPLIQTLSRTWPHGFDGWVIAKAEYRLCQAASPTLLEAEAIKKTGRYALLQARGFSGSGQLLSDLTILLAAPPASGRENRPSPPDQDTSFAAGAGPALTFSRQMLTDYLRQTGDTNPIHRRDRAVIPGLMILDAVLRDLRSEPGRLPGPPCCLLARFHHPVYAGDRVQLCQEQGRITGLCQGRRCFTVSLDAGSPTASH